METFIEAKPGDPRRLLCVRDGNQVRLYALDVGRKGKVSAQLQEVKPPERELLLKHLGK